MLDVGLQFLWGEAHSNFHYFMDADAGGEDNPGLKPLPDTGGATVNVTKNVIPETFAVHTCADGFVSAINLAQHKKWAAFLQEFDADGSLAADPRFKSGSARVLENLEAWMAAVDAALSSRTVEETLQWLQLHDIPGAPVLNFEQSFRQPQAQHMGTVVERSHTGLGLPSGVPIREIRQAGIFSDTPLRMGSPAPLFGQHTQEILVEMGMSPAQVEQLEVEEVVSTGTKKKAQE
jgi:crotonobetainyl-CoA:carnitine CoA-transferase CaiB-like acyl-CoA transferase